MSYLEMAKRVERLRELTAEYRRCLYHGFALIVAGHLAPVDETERVLQEHTKLIDELGPRRALEILRETARMWHQETMFCPCCGEPGVFHGEEEVGGP